jgi:NADH:ubiquinone oxidoreductase subunit F (NADH-binding)
MNNASIAPLPRVLDGVDGTGKLVDLSRHLRQHGPAPELRRVDPEALVAEVERAGLRGRGGAGFPTARKLRSVAARRGGKHVVINATEGEPLSRKDRVLLREAPHLVLDGAAVAARAVGAQEATIAFTEHVRGTEESLAAALYQRRGQVRDDPHFQLVATPERFLAGQETALVSYINGGPLQPAFGRPPYVRGVRGRPTLVQNAETLAHLALIARHGSAWYRELGTETEPGSALVTLAGAIQRPGVYEIEHGMALHQLVEIAGPREQIRAFLLGGFFGSWHSGRLERELHLSNRDLQDHGAAMGAGVVFVLGSSSCPVAETARVADWFADQSAGQCGPCERGLGAVSGTVRRLATGSASRGAYLDLRRWSEEIRGRGACHHPDGAVRFVLSALDTFADEFEDHAQHGACERCSDAVLPVGRSVPSLV